MTTTLSQRDSTTEPLRIAAGSTATAIALTAATAVWGLTVTPPFGYYGARTTSIHAQAGQPDPAWGAGPGLALSRLKVVPPRSDQDEVRWVKDSSGLTWDQLGRVFGVSRRAVHLWANGGRMNEINAKLLRGFSALVNARLQVSPEETRAALLALDDDGFSVVDRFRRARTGMAGTVIGAPYALDERIDVVRSGRESGA